jgi:glycosyltransferase involved in cell wall biosynthesis
VARPGRKICIVTDAWAPQVNGVVRTLETLRSKLKAQGHRVHMVTPKWFRTMPCPTYPEIPLALDACWKLPKLMARIDADAVHIATEGPIGWTARRWCIKHKVPFTTAYHTAFPEYVAARTPLSADLLYPIFRRFHAAGSGVLVATPTVREQLKAKGFKNIVNWTRGVDASQFHDGVGKAEWDFEGPVQLYVGRVAVEKNIEAFLETKAAGTKVVVGDGPAMAKLKAAYPAVKFLGPKFGIDLARAYASADVFVFPSKTDTFGLVMIEALACGTPVAAYPVQGPLDVLGADGTGPFEGWRQPIAALSDDLAAAIEEALTRDRSACAAFARKYDWDEVARQFVAALQWRNELVEASEMQAAPTPHKNHGTR